MYAVIFNNRHPSVVTEPIMFYFCLLSAAFRSNAADYVLRRFIYLFIYFFFIHRSFSETTRPIHTKFSGIVYSSVD